MLLINVTWNALRVKCIHYRLPSDPWGPRGEGEPTFKHYIIWQGEVELHIPNQNSFKSVSSPP